MKTGNRIGNGCREQPGAMEQCPEKYFPVIYPPSLYNTQIPDRF